MEKSIQREPLTKVRPSRVAGWFAIAIVSVAAMLVPSPSANSVLAGSSARTAVPTGLADEGRISGVVTDETGALIPGTRLTVVNSSTGATKETRTDGEGTYTASKLAAGTYSVMAEIRGFQSARYSNAVLTDKQVLQLDFALRIGTTAAPIELPVPAR